VIHCFQITGAAARSKDGHNERNNLFHIDQSRGFFAWEQAGLILSFIQVGFVGVLSRDEKSHGTEFHGFHPNQWFAYRSVN
jgi:hypothetical protein